MKQTKQTAQQTPSQVDELQEASKWLADFGHFDKDIFKWTADDIAEEITRAMSPLPYLRRAGVDFQEDLNPDMVCGYLDLFFAHMEYIINGHLRRLAHTKGPIKEVV